MTWTGSRGAITHMARTASPTIEPTKQAEEDWMGSCATWRKRSLVNKAKTWWVGTNVKDKPQGLTLFTGGFHAYRQYAAAADAGRLRQLQLRAGDGRGAARAAIRRGGSGRGGLASRRTRDRILAPAAF